MSDPLKNENGDDIQPTIGSSYDVDEGARLLFENWIPLRWLKRRMNPDVHIDYRIEVVENGEPRGLHFQVQIKGRSTHKRKAKELAEPLKSKHLRYYLRCEEPVFIFLIDPLTKRGHWLFIQRYLKEKMRGEIPHTQKTLTIKFDSGCSLENQSLFEKELRDAWLYMRNLHPGSPMAAIFAEKKRIEQLHPGHKVQIVATDESMHVQLSPLQPMAGGLKLKFLKEPEESELKAFFEKGQSFQANASDIQLGDSAFFPEAGDSKVTINYGGRFNGCLQFHFSPKNEPICIQVDGEWVIAPKRVSFTGQLGESPLKVDFAREMDEKGTWKPCELKFRLQWVAWAGQPFLALAYFAELDAFFKRDEFFLRFYVRGHQIWQPEKVELNNSGRKLPIKAMDWLQKCRDVTQCLGGNPPFPAAKEINELESDDVRLMVKLIDSGIHEQSIVGEEVGISGEGPPEMIEIGKKFLTASWTESCREINFFGIKIPFGPLIHTWTDLELVAAHPVSENRTEMTFKGGSKSTWKIEYIRPA